jgi:cytochrome c oxidase cbb3-type subunit IV
MFKNYLKDIEGIANYPTLSLVVFFLFFVAILVWMVKADKSHLRHMSELPLSNDSESSTN